MLESNPSRNSQLETHPNGEHRGVGLVGSARLNCLERFPHAFKTHSRKVAAIAASFVVESSIHFHRWPGCEVASLSPPTFYPCPESTRNT